MAADGCELIRQERTRQIHEEYFTTDHDSMYNEEELTKAAACYLLPDLYETMWPFTSNWWKPTPNDRIRELVKAGAMIAAEIDCLQEIERHNEEALTIQLQDWVVNLETDEFKFEKFPYNGKQRWVVFVKNGKPGDVLRQDGTVGENCGTDNSHFPYVLSAVNAAAALSGKRIKFRDN